MVPLFALAQAASLAGAEFPDAVQVGGQALSLNGLGLREKYFVDIYVGGLYLMRPTHDAAAAIAAEEPKRIVMHFVYPELSREQMLTAFQDYFGRTNATQALQPQVAQFMAWIPGKVLKGDEFTYDYVPGQGTAVRFEGRPMGAIAGAEFMHLLWGVFLGPEPPTAALKRGMLGL
jgi:hypothetical protein